MNEKETKLIIAAILHDIGKVIYREGNDVRKHSISGYDYLKETGITDKEILDAVKYHHAQSLRNADIEDNSLSYIVYMADNIASATDWRERLYASLCGGGSASDKSRCGVQSGKAECGALDGGRRKITE